MRCPPMIYFPNVEGANGIRLRMNIREGVVTRADFSSVDIENPKNPSKQIRVHRAFYFVEHSMPSHSVERFAFALADGIPWVKGSDIRIQTSEDMFTIEITATEHLS